MRFRFLKRRSPRCLNSALVRYHLAMSYIAIRQTAKASEQLRAALSLAPDAELEAKIQEALRNITEYVAVSAPWLVVVLGRINVADCRQNCALR